MAQHPNPDWCGVAEDYQPKPDFPNDLADLIGMLANEATPEFSEFIKATLTDNPGADPSGPQSPPRDENAELQKKVVELEEKVASLSRALGKKSGSKEESPLALEPPPPRRTSTLAE